jgi:hypothetical protein
MKSVPRKKKSPKYIGDDLFGELKKSLVQALEHARGERADLSTTVLPPRQTQP